MSGTSHTTRKRSPRVTPSGVLVLLALAACPPAPAPGQAPSGEPGREGERPVRTGEDALARALDERRSSLGIPGATAAIVGPDGVRWTGASGIAAPSRPMEPEMILEIGSVTKPFTAALVLTLVRDGALSLEDPLAHWRPEFPDAEKTTIRHLLQHTSGLHDCT